MLNTSPIAVLWDDSHIWGLMALRALRDLDFPVRLLKGSDIAQGALFRKQGSAAGPAVSLLVVPGGSARLKAEGLGPEGQQAVRDFVQAGGRYLGLCPWGRASYPERILHLISGHVRATISPSPFTPRWDSPEASLPVWWPGRFGNVGGDVDVLARYKAPDTDFWIADLPLSSVPSHAFRDWLARYGVNLSADFLTSSELIVHGGYGHGEYILSYSHLETPESPQANQWLCRILSLFTGATLKDRDISPWNLFSTPAASDSAPCDVEKALISWSLPLSTDSSSSARAGSPAGNRDCQESCATISWLHSTQLFPCPGQEKPWHSGRSGGRSLHSCASNFSLAQKAIFWPPGSPKHCVPPCRVP